MSQITIRPIRCLRATPNIVPRFPKSQHAVPSLSSPSIKRRPQSLLYSTSSLHHQSRRRPIQKAAICLGVSAVAAAWVITHPRPLRLDAPPNTSRDALTAGARVEVTGKDHGDNVDKIDTGTSTVPYFPRKIWLPRSGSSSSDGASAALPVGMGAAREEEEYQLLGLGIRKVSLFRIQVYVVGLYVAKSDLGRLQEELVKASVGSGASTLVQGEKQELRKTLLDGEGSAKVWGEVLKEGGVRSAVRIVPTRNTNFSHLRDGWVRGIDLRGKGKEFEGESFQAAVADFKGMLGGRGSVGKGKVLLLGRGGDGALRAWVEEDQSLPDGVEARQPAPNQAKMSLLGGLKDERVSRLVWMGYLAGDNVASDEARQSVVDGVMDIVERPIGTVEIQVL